MSKIPYHLGTEISAAMNLLPPFYRKCFKALIEGGGLDMLIGSLAADGGDRKSFSWEAAAVVLRHVIYRTLVFEKPVEFIRVLDIVRGKPAIGIGGCGLGERTIARILASLSEYHYLIKVRLDPKVAITPLYGINLPGFLQLTKMRWEEAVVSELEAKDSSWNALDGVEFKTRDDFGGYLPLTKEFKSKLARFGYGLIEDCVNFLEFYKPAFDFLRRQGPVKDFEGFLKELHELLPKGRHLQEVHGLIVMNPHRW